MDRKKLEQVLTIVGDMHDALAFHNVGDGRAKMRIAAGLVHELLKETDPVASQPALAVKGLTDDTKYFVGEDGIPLDLGAGDVLAIHGNLPETPPEAYALGWNQCRSALVASPPPSGEVEQTTRIRVPEGQTPLNDKLGHRLLDVFNEGVRSRDSGTRSPYHGHSLEHLLHASGWVQRDLRLALDKLSTAPATADGWRQEQLDAMLAAIAKVEQRTGKVYVLDPNKLADFLAAAPTATATDGR